ncbi:hypothetical protein RM572_08375 [Streptomyces sp. DSM 42041]|uniref:Uncharacterized protein n=1 Tax=Streptomyces hazeniae TaxID=3075538 RepID=A0ABU2NRD0_9ACTN|nr:hypothetical protein [Streptomyces sp. DSM 42041]MDT0378788.1 hypothetical protein [Streptomyces sp. DSM 42041]
MTTPTWAWIHKTTAAAVCALAALTLPPSSASADPLPVPSVRVRIDPTAGVEVDVRGPGVDVGTTVRPPAVGGCGSRVEAGAAPPGVRVRVSGPGCAPPPPPPPPVPAPVPEPEPVVREPEPTPPPPPPPRPTPPASPTPEPSRTPDPPLAGAAQATAPRQEPSGEMSMVTRTLLIIAPAVLAAAALRPRSSASSR